MQETAKTIIFDLSRLWLGGLRPAPRGIERVDLGLAAHIAENWRGDVLGLSWTPWGTRVFPRHHLTTLIDVVREAWREHGDPADDPAFDQIAGWLGSNAPFPAEPLLTKGQHRWRRIQEGTHLLGTVIGRSGLSPGADAGSAIPQGAIYVNLGHVGYGVPAVRRLLQARPDIRHVALVHDLLSLKAPQFFPDRNKTYFADVLASIEALADLVLTTSADVSADYLAYAGDARRKGQRVAQIDLTPVFASVPPPEPDDRLSASPYFMLCGTLEPRKNHLMIAGLWRQICEASPTPPKLVLVGGRGWGTQTLRAMLDRSPAIKNYVAHSTTLRSPGYFRLLANSRGLLAPAFAEGFGLPVAEALRMGVPVAASNIGCFAEQARQSSGLVTLIDPLDGPSWRRWIEDRAAASSPAPSQQMRMPVSEASKPNEAVDLLDLLRSL